MWRRWGTPDNFLLIFIDEVSKTQKIRPLKKWKKKKKKKIAGDIIILRMCTKTAIPEIRWMKKGKLDKNLKSLKMPSIYTIVPKIMIIGYTVSEM